VPEELELKAAVADAAALRATLVAAGATLLREGLMLDRRYDRDGELGRRDEVLRLRRYQLADGRAEGRLTWKGPARRTAEGYKRREEREVRLADDAGATGAILEAVGFRVVAAIDRWVEYWSLAGATLRLEWYPRMDVLLEVEGEPGTMERAVLATGMPRTAFTGEALMQFVRRFEARTGTTAIVALDDLGGEAPSWAAR
jgi:adenylate cyclase class IV